MRYAQGRSFAITSLRWDDGLTAYDAKLCK